MARSLMTARWWRFSEYELFQDARRFTYVRPKPGARLEEYDPWKAWEKARPFHQDRPTPYQELLNLLYEIIGSTDPLSKPPLDQAAISEIATRHSERILGWCRKFGLLGVLPHQAFFIALTPRQKRDEEAAKFWRSTIFHSFGKPAPQQLVTQVLYSRTGAPPRHWDTTEQLVNDDAFPPGVLVKTATGTFGSAPQEFVADFFPELAQARDSERRLVLECPLPLSDEFWRAYAEPMSMFLWQAVSLNRAVTAMRIKRYKPESNKQFEVYRGLDPLIGLLAPVRAVPGFQEGLGLRQGWSSSSLLGALAMMALSDLPEGEARECAECHKPFVSSGRPQSLYCSKKCRWRAQKRSQRGG